MNGDLVHPTSTCLHTELRPVDDEVFETATFAQVLDYLGGEMLRHECYALAANQVGLEVPIVIFNNIKYGFPAIPVMVNPRIVEWGSEVAPFREGCLSIPGVYRTFERPTTVVVAYQDEKGDPQSVEADGLPFRDACSGRKPSTQMRSARLRSSTPPTLALCTKPYVRCVSSLPSTF